MPIGGDIKPPAKIADARPYYSPEAIAANVEGTVTLRIHIAPDGSVVDAAVLRSIPLLDQSAIDAVRQWKFEPTIINGAPADVSAVVMMNFTLK